MKKAKLEALVLENYDSLIAWCKDEGISSEAPYDDDWREMKKFILNVQSTYNLTIPALARLIGFDETYDIFARVLSLHGPKPAKRPGTKGIEIRKAIIELKRKSEDDIQKLVLKQGISTPTQIIKERLSTMDFVPGFKDYSECDDRVVISLSEAHKDDKELELKIRKQLDGFNDYIDFIYENDDDLWYYTI